MRPRPAILVLAFLVAFPCFASAAAPAGMSIHGAVRVNDATPPAGTLVSVFVGENGPFAQAALDGDGNYDLVVPADDPATSAVDGARENESLRFVVLGGAQGGPAFASGSNVSVDITLALPRLQLAVQSVAPSAPREGEPAVLTVLVANHGLIGAQSPSLAVLAGGRIVGSGGTSDLGAGEERTVQVSLATGGLSGDVTLGVSATSRNGEADPSGNRALVTLRVAGDDAPVIASFAITPAAPQAGENITVELGATDADGIRVVSVHWRAPDGEHVVNATAPPYRVSLGAYPAGAALDVWATVTDAGRNAKTTSTEHHAITVAGASAATPTSASPPASRSPLPVGLGVVALALAAYWRRRSA